MKVILVNGSPHRNGCTNRALEEAQTVLQKEGIDTEIFWIGTKPIRGCIACMQCAKLGKCRFDDDAVNEFTEKAKEADGFVFGAPVHYASLPGAMTSFLDRTFFSATRKEINDFTFKPVFTVVSARRAGTTATLDQLNKYFIYNQMPQAGSRYWNMVHGHNPAEVEQDEEGLQIVRYAARNLAWLMKAIECGKKNGIEPPASEDVHINTNFIR